MSTFDIRALLRPSAFAHPVDAISLKETHISWVVLTGRFVYKIKKPVTLDFIDTSTLARRRFLCEEELRLNQRLASDLYIDVVPIVERDGALQIGGSETPVEYAVRMNQFDPGDELSSLLERRAISREEMERLAELLYTFHSQAARPTDATHAISERIASTIIANLADLETAVPSLLDRNAFESLSAWVRKRLEDAAPLLKQRESGGYMRECHGDLHAGNVVRYNGRLVPFDCLEFNVDLRWIDVIDDLAFLVMDLASHDREDLAFTLLSRYLEHSGDYDGIVLLRIYAAHRALVRAKVDALSARDIPRRETEFRTRFEQRIHTAQSWMQVGRPILLLMHGVSGSGKSWLSERLVAALPAIRIRSDLERKRLAGIDPQHYSSGELRDDLYAKKTTRSTYERLQRYAETCLQCGFNTIVDATFLHANMRKIFMSVAERLGIPVVIIACVSDPSVLAQRLHARAQHGDQVSDADMSVLNAQLESLQPFSDDERNRVIEVDTREPDVLEKLVSQIEVFLEEKK